MLVKVNGTEDEVPDGSNISVINNVLTINGQRHITNTNEIKVEITGGLANVNVDGNLTVNGNVAFIKAGGNVRCGNVTGDISAGGNVRCGNVTGAVTAGGNVKIS